MKFLLPFRAEPERRATEQQIEEVKRIIEEVEGMKQGLIEQANGSWCPLLHRACPVKRGKEDDTGEQKA